MHLVGDHLDVAFPHVVGDLHEQVVQPPQRVALHVLPTGPTALEGGCGVAEVRLGLAEFVPLLGARRAGGTHVLGVTVVLLAEGVDEVPEDPGRLTAPGLVLLDADPALPLLHRVTAVDEELGGPVERRSRGVEGGEGDRLVVGDVLAVPVEAVRAVPVVQQRLQCPTGPVAVLGQGLGGPDGGVPRQAQVVVVLALELPALDHATGRGPSLPLLPSRVIRALYMETWSPLDGLSPPVR